MRPTIPSQATAKLARAELRLLKRRLETARALLGVKPAEKK
jgi:hypothetical protein